MPATLNCCLLGDDPRIHSFPVDILDTQTVGHLKQLIKKATSPTLEHINAAHLELFKASIPVDDDSDSLAACFENLTLNEKPLNPMDDLSEVFQDLSEEHLHVIVRVPALPIVQATLIMPATRALNCCLLGDDPRIHSFSVDILDTQTVYELKKLIKEKRSPTLEHIDAADLDLFKASIPVDDDSDSLAACFENLTLNEKPLNPLKKLSKVFQDLPKRHIHVIVRVPDTRATGRFPLEPFGVKVSRDAFHEAISRGMLE
ncbi:hypothetical protein LshimejAT787_0506870 [Lyophyllum shimeji]|uniref:Crinkler effector protein N-terminal domain-containing protein n=1 Tax=Lyophyllum shimeji TaxID=47721 RepID=A0A9P3PP29_LYOSH|nr:hypothetical protein LshimejAT787_0506870 [Lyophyllum shimeji]